MPRASLSTPHTNVTRAIAKSVLSIVTLLPILFATNTPAGPVHRIQYKVIATAGDPTAQPGGPGVGQLASMVVDPSNPNVLYAGTAHGGAYKSTDAGGNWFAVNSGFDPSSGEFSLPIKLAIDPSNPGTLYAAFPSLYKTSDGGAKWSPVSSVSLRSSYIYSFAVDSQGTIYAGIGSAGLVKSSDGGANWSDITSGLSPQYIEILALDGSTPGTLYVAAGDGIYKTSNGGGEWSRIFTGYFASLAIDGSDSNTLYAADISSTVGRVFKTTDGGKTWLTGGAGVGARTDGQLAVDPASPGHLYVGTEQGLFESIDGGVTWTAVRQGLPPMPMSPIIDGSRPGVIYAAGAGLFRRTDGGGGWAPVDRGLPAAAVTAMAFSPLGSGTLYAGTDDGRVYLTTDGVNWSLVVSPSRDNSVTSIVVDPSSPNIVYASLEYGILKSTDGGNQWSAFGPFDYGATLIIARSNPKVLYANVGDALYRSRDGGTNWTQTDSIPSLHKAANVEINVLAVDPSNADTVYAGVHGYIDWDPVGGIFKSTDGGNNWFAANSSPADNVIGDLVINPSKPQNIYARLYLGLIKSANGGMTWKRTNLPASGPVAAVTVDQSGTIYVATEADLFVGTSAGKKWSAIRLPARFDPRVNAIAANLSDPRHLYIATNAGVIQVSSEN